LVGLSRCASNGDIYEVGHSPLTKLLRADGFHVVVSEMEDRPGAVRANLEHLPFCNQSFDLVICSDVLEHVRRYEEALSELARVVRSGGTVVLTVPFAPSEDSHYFFCVLGASPEKDRWEQDTPIHADPLNSQGCRVYRTFGKRLLVRELARRGMTSVVVTDEDIPEYGVVNSAVIVGVKA
jgi:SAM-dependent methyltransferase